MMAWGGVFGTTRIPNHEYGHLLLARDAAQMLVDTYARGAESQSVDWDDLGQAHEMARKAVDLSRCAVCKKKGGK